MTEKKFKITLDVVVSGRLIGEETDCNSVENMLGEYLHTARNTEDFTVEAKDIWATEIYEEEEK